MVKELYDVLLELRDIKKQTLELGERVAKAGLGDDVSSSAKAVNQKLEEIEGDLTQLKGEGGQDALNFPGRLDNQVLVAYLAVANPDAHPSKGAYQRLADLKPQVATLVGRFHQVVDDDLAKFNSTLRSKGAGPVILENRWETGQPTVTHQ